MCETASEERPGPRRGTAFAQLIGEGPDSEVVLDVAPELGESLGLEHQEEDDDDAESGLLDVREQRGHLGSAVGRMNQGTFGDAGDT